MSRTRNERSVDLSEYVGGRTRDAFLTTSVSVKVRSAAARTLAEALSIATAIQGSIACREGQYVPCQNILVVVVVVVVLLVGVGI